MITIISLSANNGSLAWRPIWDFDESESKEELFDLLLVELFYSADFGFKAKDINYATGTLSIADNPLYMAQGEIIPTSSYLDFAINGSGFFQVERAVNDYAFTRNGNFQIDLDGWVITEEGGYRLYPNLRIDRADVDHLRIKDNGRTLQVVKDGKIRDLYDFVLFSPQVSDTESESPVITSYGVFFFFDALPETGNYMIQQRALELSNVKIERILARISDLLFKIRAENPSVDYDFRFYMIDHLLKSQLQMGQTAQSIKRFSDLVKGVAPLLLFDERKLES
ncbi:hypothetical protein PVA45_01375 [Entomospira entomophila]|uniref:Flagellar hook protein FlgE/F/G-like D1 domain-containing protein n=1 Tax=Entomospira entomophila TaxID=2719988 RepID=A0A968KVT4_9SPIO|nr:hypothetical protein [Entomospira entomophilus]NIZ40170.1 hypothetical protein [Entomospira entomophilus]WDI35728.1 hypothetical protein PVA45_01375 [Entomospira entomophilus]